MSTKTPRFSHLPLSTSGPEKCALTGAALLRSPYFNKGSAFPAEERRAFQLNGLLPANVQTLDEQVKRAYRQYSSRQDPLAKNTFMTSMKEQNQVLYYRASTQPSRSQLIQDHLKEMFSVIYTPTEGDAIQNFSTLFRRPEGCFLNITEQDQIEGNLATFGDAEDIDYIVVTDGEQNEQLLNDEIYLGLRRPRVRGKEYDAFVGTFVKSARKLYPRAYIHFEDFALPNARRILDQYRPDIACFNDDVQGTGCVTLAAIMSGLHVSKVDLADMRMVVFGSGSAGTGIAEMVRDAIAAESGKSKEDAAKQIWCVDRPGLLLQSQGDALTHAQVPFARNDSEWEGKEHDDLLSVVKNVKPHVMVGTSTRPKSFTEEIVKEMAKHVDRPIIFPLSNPTRLHEADPKDLNAWTKGKALIATGSPFPPVEHDGKKYEVAECNNSTCFPGIGLGAVLCRARLLSDKMLVAAVKALARQSPALQDPDKGLLPDVADVREISVEIAKAVIKQAAEEGLAQEDDIPADDDALLAEWIREQMWDPSYRALQRVEPESASSYARGELGAGSSRKAS
ncbi:MAG: NAD-dependent malic enzyme, mitochondrial [Thelocarpon superellum]|nr:MAG: NAD-dependent malic enzyme, mitochondrial [Thelocarpon superellum]